ncbi:hypothetical protein Q7P35_001761 [Cladosporium inversicolor]
MFRFLAFDSTCGPASQCHFQRAESGSGVQRSAAPSLNLVDVVAEPAIRERRECQLSNAPGWTGRAQDTRACSPPHCNLGEAEGRVGPILFSSLHVELLGIEQQLRNGLRGDPIAQLGELSVVSVPGLDVRYDIAQDGCVDCDGTADDVVLHG